MATTFRSSMVEYEELKCWGCGCHFAVDKYLLDARRRTEKNLNCPNGCNLSFGESRADILEKQLTAERARHDQTRSEVNRQRDLRQQTERQLSAQRGVTTRLKNRVKNGVCPCCNRHFDNLERHMKGQHPEYAVTAE